MMQTMILTIILAPLFGAVISGVFGRVIGRVGAHCITILGMMVSFAFAVMVFHQIVILGMPGINVNLYSWVMSGGLQFNVGFLIDNLSAVMMIVVTFVSLLVHVYSIGYMRGDAGYQRFFSYISLFTFAMLMLVTANNFFQLFFGWEGVGLVSYLLIGFWFDRESANFGSLKAFIVNRVGDFGFILGIGAVLTFFGTVDFSQVFMQAPQLAANGVTVNIFGHESWSIVTVICILLFIGAMGKSAQMPLHIWLPESMEGPTPISALIHAATMVTAGVYMLARLSPLYELSASALSFILIIGATTALFTGILGVVQNDIKRVVAYSTLSQLGYMVAAMGASAFTAGIFHLVTHAAFKALLFLSAGSVIIAMHHEQDMRKMGGLRRYLPVTYVCFLIGALALAAIPPFSGFYSKDAIILAVKNSTIDGAGYAYVALLLGAFVTALYIFRAFFMTFHTKEKMDSHTREHLHEDTWVVWLPLISLAIPALLIGVIWAKPMLYEVNGLLGNSVVNTPGNYVGVWTMALDALTSLPFWLAIAGIFTAWLAVIQCPSIPGFFTKRFRWVYVVLVKKYGFDDFNQWFFVTGTRQLGHILYKFADLRIIDDGFVGGTAKIVRWCSLVLKRMQTGYLYHYALAMIVGVIAFVLWQVLAG